MNILFGLFFLIIICCSKNYLCVRCKCKGKDKYTLYMFMLYLIEN